MVNYALMTKYELAERSRSVAAEQSGEMLVKFGSPYERTSR